MDISPQQLQNMQGTRLSEKAPWETYKDEMEVKLPTELEDAIKRYEERRYEKATQQQLEELARQKEMSDALSKDYQWVKPEEYEYIAPRIGHIIHSSVFITELREKCNLKCWYVQHPLPKRLTLIVKREDAIDPEIAVWLMEGFMPEYSVMKFDEHKVPLDERLRGWRTVLLQLILKGILKEELAHKVFGEAQGPASEKYNSLLFELRNRRIKVKEENAGNIQ